MEAAARAALNASGDRRAARPVPRQGRADVRRRERPAERPLRDARRTTSCRGSAPPTSSTSKTVLRGGYGMFYGFLGQRRGDVITQRLQLDDQPDAVARQRPDVHRDAVEPVPAAASRSRSARPPGIADVPRPDHHATSIPNPKSPRMQRWQVGVQRELPGRWVLEAAYVGNHGTDIQTSRNINATPTAVPEHQPGPRSGDDQLPDARWCRIRSSG